MATSRSVILVAVDFDGASKRALEEAKWMAGAIDADVVLLHVHSRQEFDHPQLSHEMVARIDGLAEQTASELLASLGAAHGAARTLLRHGDPAARIVETAAELGAVMVVMGTHGRHGLQRFLVGSVAAQVVRKCPTPVLTVRARPEDTV